MVLIKWQVMLHQPMTCQTMKNQRQSLSAACQNKIFNCFPTAGKPQDVGLYTCDHGEVGQPRTEKEGKLLPIVNCISFDLLLWW